MFPSKLDTLMSESDEEAGKQPSRNNPLTDRKTSIEFA